MYDQILWHMYQKHPKGELPLFLSRWALRIKPIRRYLRVEREALDYFTLEGTFDCKQAITDLEGTTIQCPPLSSQLQKMVEFYHEHSSEEHLHIRIN